MEQNENLLISHVKDLDKQTYTTVFSINIDSNVNVKTILDVNCFLCDDQVEAASGKAVVAGKLGCKVLYVDTDGMSNSVAATQNFSETILDAAITADCKIHLSNTIVTGNVLSTDGVLKISAEVNTTPQIYHNLALNNKIADLDDLVVKKCEVETTQIATSINSSFEYVTSFETNDRITKVLCFESYFNPTNLTALEGSVLVEGQLFSKLVYEQESENSNRIKELCDTFTVKTELPAEGVLAGAMLDVNFYTNKQASNFTLDLEDGQSIVTLTNVICVRGAAFSKLNIELVEDLYSTAHETEISSATREYLSNMEVETFNSTVSGEYTIADEDSAIDSVVCNLSFVPEITNAYIKDGCLVVEGIVSSHAVYLDENANHCHKETQVPFIFNTKIKAASIDCTHYSIYVVDSKIKPKRGTILEMEYGICLRVCVFSKCTKEVIDSVQIGKPYSANEYDYQIFLAKAGETQWELGKRIRITPDELNNTNKNLPLVCSGGEKIIIKRA